MKLKINKACDLSSISVLPPYSRRGNAISSAMDSSVFGKSQASQLRSQSQQSFSQGMSLSQLSQSSLDEIVTNEQRLCSQERDNSLKRISCLAPITYAREDTQMAASRSSNNVIRRWNSAPVPDHRCQVSEELEHRIGLVETSLSRLGRIMDSVQSDIMQVNKAVKEVSLETEGIRQKMMVHDNSLQLMLKGEEDIKASLDGNLRSISDQLRKESEKNKLEEILSVFSTLPDQIEARLSNLQNELCWAFTKELAMLTNEMPSNPKHPFPSLEPLKRRSSATQSQKNQLLMMENPIAFPMVRTSALVPKEEPDILKSLKPNPVAFIDKKQNMELKQKVIPLKGKEWSAI
ncbi:putative recombination initiation defects 3 isoform X2 [Tasmannia lanceolata]|uniref:putative recombination initiation defects 3 isoform X2 n=1 Tax=Tasmannia lanceolata TaxID=3420 RepID=UPI0040639305